MTLRWKADKGLFCEHLNAPITGAFRDCEHYQPDKLRVRQHRWLVSGSKKSKTGINFRVCVSSCSNCLHSVNLKDRVVR